MRPEPGVKSIAIEAASAPTRAKPSNYPEPFFSRMSRREKRPLGDLFGLKNFGVNLTTLHPGGESALLHRHSKQDEFIYVLQGNPTLVTDRGEVALAPGMCAGDEGSYPVDDIKAMLGPDGKWQFTHKDGSKY
jgi:uncharacterized cupin superfamily protein